MSARKSVFGIYDFPDAVELAVARLRECGFRQQDISVLMPQNGDVATFAHVRSTKAPEGASVGATAGGLVGGALGWLVGIGALAIPGMGPFIAAGPIMAALAGVGIGATAGGVSGALVGLGMPEYEAKRYEGMLNAGGILMSIHCDDAEWIAKARDLLERTGARDIESADEAYAGQPFPERDHRKPATRPASPERSL